MAWADLAISGAQSIGSYILQAAEAKNRRKWQKYHNTMLNLQAAQNQNTLTDNENMARERSQEEAFLIRRSEYITKASVEVAAAATGTTGRSVNMVLFDVGRNAAIADRDRQRDLQLQYLSIDNQRRSVALDAKLAQDNTHIPSPNPFSAALGFMGSVDLSGFKNLNTKPTPRNTGPADPWVMNGVNMRL